MRLSLMLTAAAATLGLTACNAQESSERAVEEAGGSVPTMQRTAKDADERGAATGAAGATTSAADPNPSGAGATTGARPGDASGAMGSTSPAPKPPVSTLPTPQASNMPTPAEK